MRKCVRASPARPRRRWRRSYCTRHDRRDPGMLRGQARALATIDARYGAGADRRRRNLVTISADAVCPVSIAAVVLAAGASARLGRPKQQLVLAGETLLGRTVRLAREAEFSPIVV